MRLIYSPLYVGRGAISVEDHRVWSPFAKRLAESRIALLTSAGLYLKGSQQPFDLESERARPEWGDPTWRSIPASATPDTLGLAHLHINDEDVLADPEIALPMRGLQQLVEEGVVGGAAAHHVSAMGYQHRQLKDWHETTAAEIAADLREQGIDGLILAPA